MDFLVNSDHFFGISVVLALNFNKIFAATAATTYFQKMQLYFPNTTNGPNIPTQ